MLKVVISRVRPDKVDRLRSWMAELQSRREEVLETFSQETVRHEVAYLLSSSESPVLVYAMEAEDHEAARRAYLASDLPIDQQHREVMAEVLDGAADAELLYECAVP